MCTAAVQARPTPAVLQQCLAVTTALLGDEAAATTKAAVNQCFQLFRAVLAAVAAQGGHAESAAALRPVWEVAEGLKAAVAALAASHKNDGVRLGAAKFLEQAVLLLTADSMPPVPGLGNAPLQLVAGNQVLARILLLGQLGV